jgi:hypothetical protein
LQVGEPYATEGFKPQLFGETVPNQDKIDILIFSAPNSNRYLLALRRTFKLKAKGKRRKKRVLCHLSPRWPYTCLSQSPVIVVSFEMHGENKNTKNG